ncbi:hypothetical protein PRIPAC_75486 [Pristionchus pacificus]|uniref:DZF domain-containing protein n=1 Tax=Pristionchus pacificus TaxID=54126 RepID=A0A2A6C6N2_PRIPA|nr:hypothetical protein PRIPAC_75486 [Pristionchus pacificus]|eukprot:PDM73681.1 hypothetical protein PRIPAC_41037 [Pristionchus pacificus]
MVGQSGYVRAHPYRNKPFPFDLVLAPDAFPLTKEMEDGDAKLTEEVLAAATALEPTDKERAEMGEFVTKVKTVLDKMMTTTDVDYLPGVVLEQYSEVGSYKKDTTLRGHRIADIVVVTKSMPTFEAVASIGQKMCNELSDGSGVVSMVSRDFGLILTKKEDKVRLLVSTQQSNTSSLEKDLHLPLEMISKNQAAIYHAKRFEGFSATPEIRPVIRVFKAMRRRFPGLEPINIWAFESLIQYCLITTPSGFSLSAGPAFKRVLSMLSAGIFLPGSSGLGDPVDARFRLCDQLGFDEMDTACSTAQTLLRILCNGGAAVLLGTADKIPDISVEVTDLNGICVAPLEKAYVPPVGGGEEKNGEASMEAATA